MLGSLLGWGYGLERFFDGAEPRKLSFALTLGWRLKLTRHSTKDESESLLDFIEARDRIACPGLQIFQTVVELLDLIGRVTVFSHKRPPFRVATYLRARTSMVNCGWQATRDPLSRSAGPLRAVSGYR
jgi:hypothetical protein